MTCQLCGAALGASEDVERLRAALEELLRFCVIHEQQAIGLRESPWLVAMSPNPIAGARAALSPSTVAPHDRCGDQHGWVSNTERGIREQPICSDVAGHPGAHSSDSGLAWETGGRFAWNTDPAKHLFVPASGSQDESGNYTRCSVNGCDAGPADHLVAPHDAAEGG